MRNLSINGIKVYRVDSRNYSLNRPIRRVEIVVNCACGDKFNVVSYEYKDSEVTSFNLLIKKIYNGENTIIRLHMVYCLNGKLSFGGIEI